MYEPIDPVQSTTNTRSSASGCGCVPVVEAPVVVVFAAFEVVSFVDAGVDVSAGTSGVVPSVVGAGAGGGVVAVVVEDAFPIFSL